MARDTADYEGSEEIAIASGKEALSKAPWLFNRNVGGSGFFVSLKKNNLVHPNHFAVHGVDGVGTKLFLAPWSGNYVLQMIDGIRMDANDFATIIHAYPDTVNLYFAMQTEVEEQHMGQIMEGVRRGLEGIRIPSSPFDVNIGKLETASLDEMISLGVKNKGFDVGVVMTGYIEKDRLPNLDPKPGHVIVGVSSTGLHSNSFTGARHAILTPEVEYREEWKSQYTGRWGLDDKPECLEGQTVLEALQTPTALYLAEAIEVGRLCGDPDVYGVNITGNGFANFNRAGRDVSFEITDPFEPLPVHRFLAEESGWSPEVAYSKQNMGTGFGYIFPSQEMASKSVDLINKRGENRAKIMGEVVSNKGELRTAIHKPYEGKPVTLTGYNN